jgi:hypothetical protein
MALHLLFVGLGVLVPLYGVLAWGWSIATAMILLALECLLSFGPMARRIQRHEQVTQDPRHHQPSVYARFGKWEIPATAGRFRDDYLARGGVAAVLAVGLAFLMPLLYGKKYPAQAHLVQVQWDGVALGTAVAVALALAEVGVQSSRWGREPFPDLHRAAGVPVLMAIGLLLLLMFTPLWADWIRHPLVLLLPLIGLRGWLEATRGAPRA